MSEEQQQPAPPDEPKSAARFTPVPRKAFAQRNSEARDRRLQRQKDRREKNLERFGLDVAGDAAAVAEDRRRLRNARKRERRQARG